MLKNIGEIWSLLKQAFMRIFINFKPRNHIHDDQIRF